MWTPKDDEIAVGGVRYKKRPEPSPNPIKSVKPADPYPPKSEVIPPEKGKRLVKEFLAQLDGKETGRAAPDEIDALLESLEEAEWAMQG